MAEVISIRRKSPPQPKLLLRRAREVQRAWAEQPLADRLAVVEAFRGSLASSIDALVGSVGLPQRGGAAETIAAEILPLAEACRYLVREAEQLLQPRRLGRRGRPAWLAGSSVELRREALGVVLVIAPSNYPILLPGVQALQALVAGNAVLLKPGRGALASALVLQRLWAGSGLPDGLLQVLEEAPQAATSTIEAGVDKVLLTGSVETGRAVYGRLAASLTPAVMELSGCDAAFVREDADLALAAKALRFGATFNGGFTCIAPRRVFVARERMAELERLLVFELRRARPVPVAAEIAAVLERLIAEATGTGARLAYGPARPGPTTTPILLADTSPWMGVMRADVPAPLISLIPVDGDDHALELAGQCDYALGASVFGRGPRAAELARRVQAGVVVINDMIVPTADPRVPFGGRGASGFGVTRGAEGLLELTRLKTVIRRKGRSRVHFEPTGPIHEELLKSYVRAAHDRSWSRRVRSLWQLLRLGRRLTTGARRGR